MPGMLFTNRSTVLNAMLVRTAILLGCLTVAVSTVGQEPAGKTRLADIRGIAEQAGLFDPEMGGQLAALDELYQDLHRNPELSLKEERTAALLAKLLRETGFEVTESVGGLGVVGVLNEIVLP